MIRMNLKDDVRRVILANLPHDTADAKVAAKLAGMDLGELVVVYHNWLSRLVPSKPRQVLRSKELVTNPLRQTFDAALAEVTNAIEKGLDLTPRLSKAVATYGYVACSSSVTRDKDLMLNDWGVHHLHLGTGPDARDARFIQRTDELLFVMFHGDSAYLLDIVPHKHWTRQDIVRIAVTNWPEAELFLEMKGVRGATVTYTEDEHATLRKAGIATMVEVDGKLFVARGMLATAGTSIKSTRAADHLLDAIEAFETMCRDEPEKVEAQFAQHGLLWPKEPAFEFVFLPTGFGVVERSTGVVIGLGK